VLKKSVKAAGFGLNHVNEEFTSGGPLDKLMAPYEAACGAAATNIFQPIRLSFYTVFMQLQCEWMKVKREGESSIVKRQKNLKLK